MVTIWLGVAAAAAGLLTAALQLTEVLVSLMANH